MPPAAAAEALREAVDAAISAADPAAAVRAILSADGGQVLLAGEPLTAGDGRLFIIGAGKAATAMASATAAVCGPQIAAGEVIGPEAGAAGPIRLHAGTHPIPSERTVRATQAVRELCASAAAADHVLCLLSGGASSFLTAPAAGLTLADLRATTSALLAAGLSIEQVNTVRRHCSSVKGGKLAEACHPAAVTTIAISDVVGDHPAAIGSGPTVADPTSFADASTVIETAEVSVPPAVRAHLRAGAAGDRTETPDVLSHNDFHIIANCATAVEAAAAQLRAAGWPTRAGPDDLAGDATAVADRLLSLVDDVPQAVVAGGEATVMHDGTGRGGPTQEVALRVADRLDAGWVAAVDTDGSDGSTDAAGALVPAGPLDATVHAALDAHDVYGAIADRGWHIHTGPTGTNVNDLYLLAVS
jgi:hydroxypyruvate reductase